MFHDRLHQRSAAGYSDAQWRRKRTMNKIAKLALGAAMAAGVALSAAAPAEAGVSVGIGIGVPGPGYGYGHGNWCYYHPGACGGGYAYGGPAIGVYVGGHGYWDGHRYWGHRSWGHGGWRYR
jgi:hypothetical protein